MKEYYVAVSNGDKLQLTKEEFELMEVKIRRNIVRNTTLEDGSIILGKAIVYLGIDGEDDVEEPTMGDLKDVTLGDLKDEGPKDEVLKDEVPKVKEAKPKTAKETKKK